MLQHVRAVIDSPDLVATRLRNRLKESARLLRSGYPLDALLHSVPLAGSHWHLSYLRLKSSDGRLVREFHGSEMELPVDDPGVARDLLVRGTREAESAEVFKRELRRLRDRVDPPIVSLDVGANIGYFTLMQAAIFGDDGAILSIEPVPENLERLEHNVELNGYECVEFVRGVLSDTSGEAELALNERSNLHRVAELLDENERNRTITVPAWSGDELVREHGYGPADVRVVRMDVEGYESTIVEGMREVLSAPGPRVIGIEIHTRTIASGDPEAFVRRLEDWGYELVFGYWDRPNRDDMDRVFETWDEVARSGINGVEIVARKRR